MSSNSYSCLQRASHVCKEPLMSAKAIYSPQSLSHVCKALMLINKAALMSSERLCAKEMKLLPVLSHGS